MYVILKMQCFKLGHFFWPKSSYWHTVLLMYTPYKQQLWQYFSKRTKTDSTRPSVLFGKVGWPDVSLSCQDSQIFWPKRGGPVTFFRKIDLVPLNGIPGAARPSVLFGKEGCPDVSVSCQDSWIYWPKRGGPVTFFVKSVWCMRKLLFVCLWKC